MPKIDVILNAVLQDGKDCLQPGATVAMDQERAKRLASLGMVKLLGNTDKPRKKNGKTKQSKTQEPLPPVPPEDSTESYDDEDEEEEN
jgi:hypothetical protein